MFLKSSSSLVMARQLHDEALDHAWWTRVIFVFRILSWCVVLWLLPFQVTFLIFLPLVLKEELRIHRVRILEKEIQEANIVLRSGQCLRIVLQLRKDGSSQIFQDVLVSLSDWPWLCVHHVRRLWTCYTRNRWHFLSLVKMIYVSFIKICYPHTIIYPWLPFNQYRPFRYLLSQQYISNSLFYQVCSSSLQCNHKICDWQWSSPLSFYFKANHHTASFEMVRRQSLVWTVSLIHEHIKIHFTVFKSTYEQFSSIWCHLNSGDPFLFISNSIKTHLVSLLHFKPFSLHEFQDFNISEPTITRLTVQGHTIFVLLRILWTAWCVVSHFHQTQHLQKSIFVLLCLLPKGYHFLK